MMIDPIALINTIGLAGVVAVAIMAFAWIISEKK